VVTLPCKHPFHEPCIIPWLKSSGTCPVCRHALVPQPEHHPLPPRTEPNTNRYRNHPPSPSSPSHPSRETPTHDVLHSLFGGFAGGRSNSYERNNGSPSRHNRSNSDPTSRPLGRGSDTRNHFPGGWSEDLD